MQTYNSTNLVIIRKMPTRIVWPSCKNAKNKLVKSYKKLTQIEIEEGECKQKLECRDPTNKKIHTSPAVKERAVNRKERNKFRNANKATLDMRFQISKKVIYFK